MTTAEWLRHMVVSADEIDRDEEVSMRGERVRIRERDETLLSGVVVRRAIMTGVRRG